MIFPKLFFFFLKDFSRLGNDFSRFPMTVWTLCICKTVETPQWIHQIHIGTKRHDASLEAPKVTLTPLIRLGGAHVHVRGTGLKNYNSPSVNRVNSGMFSLPFLKAYRGPAQRRGLERGGLEDSLGCSS